MQSFNQECTLWFDIGDLPTAVTCLLIAAESFKQMSCFKWKAGLIFQTDGRKAKLSQFILTELFFDDAVDLVLSAEIINTLAFGFEAKSFVKQNTW